MITSLFLWLQLGLLWTIINITTCHGCCKLHGIHPAYDSEPYHADT